MSELEELRAFVRMVANDYVELSHDKVRWQRDDYMKIARQLLTKHNPPTCEEAEDTPLDDDF